MLTKKNVLIISVAAVLLAPAIFFLIKSDFCYYSSICQKFLSMTVVDFAIYTFLCLCISSTLFVLPFSLFTYKMSDEIFKFWLKFSAWGIPVALLSAMSIYFATGGEDPFRGGGIVFFWVILYAVYFTLTLALLVYKYFLARR